MYAQRHASYALWQGDPAAVGLQGMGLGLKWYEYVTGVPSVSSCFAGNSEYLANVQRTVAAGQAGVQSIVDQFQTAGPEVQAFLNEPKVQALLTWCGQRNAFDYWGYLREVTSTIGPAYVAKEAQRLAAAPPPAPPTTPVPVTPSTPLPPATPTTPMTTTATQYIGTAFTEAGRVAPGAPGYEDTNFLTNVFERLKAVPPSTWLLIALAVGGTYVVSRKR